MFYKYRVGMLCLFSVLLLFVIICFFNSWLSKDTDFSVVIIGGGLAGLSAAHDLRDLDVLLLEKEPQLGGRVLTRQKAGLSYDLGAVYAFPLEEVSFDITPPRIVRNDQDIIINYNNNNYRCSSLIDCISELDISIYDKNLLFNMDKGIHVEWDRLDDNLYNIVNSIMRVILPGKVDDYPLSIQGNIFRMYFPEFFVNGNSFIIEEFSSRITATILLNATVLSVSENNGVVTTTFIHDSQERTVTSNAAIVAVPAPIARQLVKKIPYSHELFFNNLRYHQYTVVSFGLSNDVIQQFSYVIPISGTFNTVIRFPEQGTSRSVFVAYYGDEESEELKEWDDDAIVRRTLVEIDKMQLGKINLDDLLFYDVHYWQYADHSHTKVTFDLGNEELIKISRRIFLAGDYCTSSAIYGMTSAVESGFQAASLVRDELK
jgi:predicted NAD/FAD-dependent oxidoreductase